MTQAVVEQVPDDRLGVRLMAIFTQMANYMVNTGAGLTRQSA